MTARKCIDWREKRLKPAGNTANNSTVPAYSGHDSQGRSYVAALRDHDRFPAQNPNLPNPEDYRVPMADYPKADRLAAAALAQDHPKSVPVPNHQGTVRTPSGHNYNAGAVDAAIASSNRSGRKIGGREASLIHRILRG